MNRDTAVAVPVLTIGGFIALVAKASVLTAVLTVVGVLVALLTILVIIGFLMVLAAALAAMITLIHSAVTGVRHDEHTSDTMNVTDTPT